MSFVLKIGLECHSRLKCYQKLFSGMHISVYFTDSLNFALLSGCKPNEHVSKLDLGIPGQLPILNQAAVHQALRACLLMKCTIQPSIVFDRKHYLYPDLPQGFQITQKRYPIGYAGLFEATSISRVQLETDTAKLIESKQSKCYLDFNRGGVA